MAVVWLGFPYTRPACCHLFRFLPSVTRYGGASKASNTVSLMTSIVPHTISLWEPDLLIAKVYFLFVIKRLIKADAYILQRQYTNVCASQQ